MGKKVPRKDKKISYKDFVCALHFKSDDIMTHFEIQMTGGIIHKTLERKNPILWPRSVPSIFPNLPKYLCSSKRKRPALMPRSLTPTKIKYSLKNNTNTYDCQNNDQREESINTSQSTEKLIEIVKSLVDETIVNY